MSRRHRSRVVAVAVLLTHLIQLVPIPPAEAQAPAAVTLTPLPTPSSAQPGVTLVNLFGNGFPAGAITPAAVTVFLDPQAPAVAPSVQTPAVSITTLTGSSRRVTFRVPDLPLPAATTYRVTLRGTTTTGVPFQSTNVSLLLVAPPPTLTAVAPAFAFQGTTILVTLDGQYTNFVQGLTTASFGPGVSVGGAAVGGLGPVAVLSPTRAQAQVTIGTDATLGPRAVEARTGAQVVSKVNAFSVVGPTIIGLEPATLLLPGEGGTGSLTVRIQNPNPTRAMQVSLISADEAVASVPPTIALPPGETTGAVTVTAGGSGGPVLVTATLNGTSASSSVTVSQRPPPPVLTEPLADGAVNVGGTGVATALVNVFVNGAPAASGLIDDAGRFGLAVATPLAAGQVVTATQTLGGLTSLTSQPVVVRAGTPAPTLIGPLVAGTTSVTGTGTPTATVNVFADGNAAGTGIVLVDGRFSVAVPALVAGQMITATQTVAGVPSIPSAPLVVVAVSPAPTITGPLVEGGTALSGTGVSGATVEAFVEGSSAGTAIVSGAGTWTLVLGAPLVVGQHVTARQTLGGVPSALAPELLVQALPPPPAVNAPLVEGGTTVTGAGVVGAMVRVFIGGAPAGSTTVAADGRWAHTLAAALVAGQRVTARQFVGDIGSGLSAEVIVVARPPAPAVSAPLVEGETTLTGTGAPGAAVEAFVDGVSAGTTVATGAGAWTIALGTPLVAGQRVAARQSTGGIDSPLSPEIVVGAVPPPPTVTGPLVAGAVSVTGSGVGQATVEVFADGASLGTTSVNNSGFWSLPVAPALAAGQSITAVQSVAGIASELSAAVIVSAALTRIDITPAPAATVTVGDSITFSARGGFSDGSVLDPLPGVQWTSSAATVVSVNAGGIADAIAPGVAAIRADRDGVQSAATSISVKPRPPSVGTPLLAGATSVGGAAADPGAAVQVFVNGAPRGTPASADAAGLWLVAGFAPPLALDDLVVARQTAGGVESDPSEPVVVSSGAPVLASIVVTPGSLTLASGDEQAYTATGRFSDGSTRDITSEALWETTSAPVASITAAGLARAADAGVTTIRATRNGIVGSASLTVTGPTLESIVVKPAAPTILVGETQAFTATGVLSDGTSQALSGTAAWTSSAGAIASINAAGVATALAAGTTTIAAKVGAVTGSVTLTVSATVPDGTAPIAVISSPANNSTVTNPTAIVGTASDANFLKYVLEVAPAGAAAFTIIASGLAPVVNGTLGTFDPTTLLNDLYTVRLTVFDQGGNASATTTTYQVSRDVKVGNFTLAFEDLKILAPGLPITVTRVYDSRERAIGDFGFGWRLDLQSLRLRVDGQHGSGWNVSRSGGIFPTYTLTPAREHRVSVTLPDGKVEVFDLTPSPASSVLFPLTFVTAAYTARPGTFGTLVPLDGGSLFVIGSQPGAVDLVDFGTFEVYDPALFRYTTPEGTSFLVHRTSGIQSLQDPNGNTLSIGPGGITHSAGPSAVFTRDGQGRILTIADAAGAVHTYAYDANGDLSSYRDPQGSITRYFYNLSHGLIEIRDPRGLRPLRNEYDDAGRLVRSIDALGKAIEYQHDLNARQEIVRDRLGRVTLHEYDNAGNVIRTTDALGAVTTRTYDARGNQLTETNALGHTRAATYDARDNRLTDTNALGQTTTYTYNDRRQLLSVRDPLGRLTTNQYDAAGNLTRTTGPAGDVTTHAYDARGLHTSTTDPLGNVTTYSYNAAGRLTQQTDPLGHVTSFTYDGNGNRLTETRTRTIATGVETLLTQFQFDPSGRLTRTTFPDGSSTQSVYNALGKPAVAIDQLGRQTLYVYDAIGQLIRTTFADGSTETASFDAEGRKVTSTDRSGRVTQFAYDALGRLTTTTFPDGTSTTATFDAAGRAITVTDARGIETRYSYDNLGRRRQITDALGHVTAFAYDAAGNLQSMTDGNGRVTSFEYDAHNRATKVNHPDGTSEETGYDAIGRVTSKRDQAGVVTLYAFDRAGRLITVTDALGQSTAYTYDEVGNRLTQEDANGHVTRFAHDGMGRQIERRLPLGMAERTAYDAAGNLTTKTDFNGFATTYAHDAVNRLTSKTPDARRGEPTVSFAYTPTGQRSRMVDASGATTYAYDERDRLLQKSTPQGSLTYTYDEVGNVVSVTSSNANGTSVEYAYDDLSRLESVTDNRLASGVTTLSYDNTGNLSRLAYPNSVVHSYAYNAVNRLTDLTVTSASGLLARYGYALGVTGRRDSVVEHTGRRASYAYDALYRLTSETITGGSSNGTIGHDYDPVGNRLERTSTVAQVAPTRATYDANDRLDAHGYDAGGSTTSAGGHAYRYDFENRLISKDGGALAIVYDGDGNRVARTVGGVTTRYLVDDRNPSGFAQVVEETIANNVVRRYTYGLFLLSQTSSEGTSFYVWDGHSGVRRLADESGAVVASYDYDATGVLIARAGARSNPHLYRGEYFDSELNLYFLRARYLDVDTNRFWTIDPYEGNLDEPQSLHRYLYANADPANRLDPSGEFSIGEVAISMAIRGALVSLAFSVPLRALQVALAVAAGADLGAAVQEAAFGVLTDVALGALLGGAFAFAPRLIALRSAGQAVQRAANSAWNLTPFARGRAIEALLLRGAPNAIRTPNFPVIDHFWQGVATSIKSIDATAASYQAAGALVSRVSQYARSLSQAGVLQQGALRIDLATATSRNLVIALENGALTVPQAQALRQFLQTAQSQWPNVRIILQFIP